MNPDNEFEVRVDDIDRNDWNQYFKKSTNSSIYQSWEYGDAHTASLLRSVSRLCVLYKNNVVSCVQVLIKGLPFLKIGTADIDWGPFVLECENLTKDEILNFTISAILKEYDNRRGLKIRLRPNLSFDSTESNNISDLLYSSGFFMSDKYRPYHTTFLDLNKGCDGLRAQFHTKWRGHLKTAEKSNLKIDIGVSSEHLNRFLSIYDDMWNNKKFSTGVNMEAIAKCFENMPAEERPFITIASDETGDIGGTVCTLGGDTVIYFLGATRPGRGRKSRPGYMMQWVNISRAIELGYRWYDLGGIDEDLVPEIAGFKLKMRGDKIVFPGEFCSKGSFLNRILFESLLGFVNKLKS